MKKAFVFAWILGASLAWGAPVANATDLLVATDMDHGQDYAGSLYWLDTNAGITYLDLQFSTPVYPGPVYPHPGYPYPGYPGHFPPPPPPPMIRTIRVGVPGLIYDAAAGEVAYLGERGKVVCAGVRQATGWFGRKKLIITPTGECRTYARLRHGGPYRAWDVFFRVND